MTKRRAPSHERPRGHEPCPCGLDASYDACCARFHRGAEPPDAALLMRSRYSAFVRGDFAYLFRTLHSEHDDRATETEDAFVRRFRAGQRHVVYRRLTVLDADGPDAAGVARVLFHAEVRARGEDRSFVEASSFVHEGTGWRYIAGRAVPARAAGDLGALTLASFDAA